LEESLLFFAFMNTGDIRAMTEHPLRKNRYPPLRHPRSKLRSAETHMIAMMALSHNL
jgi:hypothetical protein